MSGERIRRVAARFAVEGEWRGVAEFRHGHIHETHLLTLDCGGPARRFLLQRMNDAVFPQPARVMDNIHRVLGHLRAKFAAAGVTDIERRVLTLVPTRTGGAFHRDIDGGYWRLYQFIEGTRVCEVVRAPVYSESAGRAFGLFHQLLADLPPPRLHEVIPHFHDTPRRLVALERAVAADVCGRAAEVRAELDFVWEHRSLVGGLIDRLRDGELPERIVHNDAKISNVLLDDRTGEALCVTDLDTVMPGTVLYDFGDMVRSTATTAAEDEPETARVTLDQELFAGLTSGYLRSAASFLTPAERKHLVLAGQVITLEQGIRFLADYLQGDTYYRTAHPGHNLQRCRTQLRLTECLVQHAPDLQRLVASASGG